MRSSNTNVQLFLTVFLLCFMNLGYNAQILGLYEDEICRKGDGKTPNSICRNIERCPVAKEGLKKNIIPQLCSFNGSIPIVCCPPEKNTNNQITTTTKKPSINPVLKSYSATEMCSEYSELIYHRIKDPILISDQENYLKVKDCYDAITLITNGTDAKPKEFPHMALLGYSEKPDINSWACGGSLISKRFVLTAAHCEKLGSKNEPRFASWARLGELDYLSETDEARPKDYRIVQRIIHPNYKSTSSYHDIALFRLERDVDFSAFVRPICLNTDNTLRPPAIIATGWGKTDVASLQSSHLLKVRINTISAEECDKSFLYLVNRNEKLAQGIVDNLMVCAGNPEGGNDTCGGDSGGPIQIKHNRYTCMYSQIGITSFAGQFCGEKDSPAVYTRVSNYISWIESIVWPKM
ncbi:serine protease-like precursor [Acyrthosiphon pisum]|uniref:ACYPI000297 protein n=1 Tax=Acyrthosiphon pisum TaxID=7029 RepID=C4WVF5_ACYPI|nr:serine protease-like precursor [Acyrthosiphon pisum]BAH71875.1 ACYPI000297 [Acyrthosiphon pisum]|eukprot:NP_001155379.1 serine protease-like precursor [Acyrthosiphon pisum]